MKNLKSFSLVLLLVICVSAIGCAASSTAMPPQGQPSSAAPSAAVILNSPDRLAIYSAVAHYAFDPSNKMGSGARQYPIIFVSPNLATSLDPRSVRWDGDPTPPELLPLLQDLAPRREFATLDAVVQRDKMNAVRDDGIWLGFGAIRIEGNEVRVGAETFLNGVNAVAYEYQLARQGGRWMVLRATQLWIS